MTRQFWGILSLLSLLISGCGESEPRLTPEGTIKVFQDAIRTCNFKVGWETMALDTRYEEFGGMPKFQMWCLNRRHEVEAIADATIHRIKEINPVEARVVLYNATSKDYVSIHIRKDPATKLWSVVSFRSGLSESMAS